MKNILQRSLAFLTALMLAFSSATMNGTVLVYAAEEDASSDSNSTESESFKETDEDMEQVADLKESKEDPPDEGQSQEQNIEHDPSTTVDVTWSIANVGDTKSNIVVDGTAAYFDSLYFLVTASPDGEVDEVKEIALIDNDGAIVQKMTNEEESITNVGVVLPITKSFTGLSLKVTTKELESPKTFAVADYIDELASVETYNYAPLGVDIKTDDDQTTVKSVVVDGVNYITQEGMLVENITSDAPINQNNISVEVTVDGTPIDGGFTLSKVTDLKYNLSVDVSELDGTTIGITATAVDILGRGQHQDATLVLVRNEYDLTMSNVVGTRTVTNGVTYGSSTLGVTLEASGTVSALEVLKDGTSFAVLGTTGGFFNIDASGTYTVKLTDVLGNVTTYNLEDISGATDITSTVVIDTSAPEITITKNPDLGDGWYNTLPSVNVSVADDNLSQVVVSLDQDEIVSTSQSSVDLDISGIDDGSHTIYVTATDMSGASSSASTKLNIDRALGDVTARVSENYVLEDGVAYFRRNPNVIITPPESNLAYYLDGTAVSSSFALSKSGQNQLLVVDRAGNQKSYNLDDLLGFDTHTYVVDGTAPSITENFESYVTSNGKKWYSSKNPVLKYTIREDNIKSVTAYLNGTAIDLTRSLDATNTVQIPTNDVVENKNTLYLEVADKAGNSTTRSATFEFWVDTKYPEMGITTISPAGTGSTYADGSHFKTPPTITINGRDDGVGIKEYRVNNQVVRMENGKGIRSNLTNGSYTLSVIDKFDRATTKELGSTFGDDNWQTNAVIVDSKDPVIVRDDSNKRFSEGDYRSGSNVWFGSEPTLYYTVSDDNLLAIKVKVNNATEYNVRISGNSVRFAPETTNMVEGDNKIVITAIDKSGRVVSDTYNFKLDKTSPTLVSRNIGGNQYSEATYFKSAPTINLQDSYDKLASGALGSGIKTFYLDNDNTSHSATNYTFSLAEGEHKFRVEDNVGHKSAWISLKDTQGWQVCTTSKVIIDGTAPTITRNGTIFNGVYNDGKSIWFGEKPDLGYTVTDSYLDTNLVTIKTNSGTVHKGTASPTANKGDMAEGSNTVVVSATDKAGNSASDTYSFKVDLTKPVVRAKDIGGVKYANDGTYFQSNPTLDISSSTDPNSGSGIKVFTLNRSQESTKGTFTIGETGEYTVTATDNVGHTSDVYTVGGLMGWTGTNKIVIDRFNPSIIRFSGFNAKSIGGNNWYANSPSLVYDVNDDNLLNIWYTLNGGSQVKINKSSDGKIHIPAGIFAEYNVNNIFVTAQDKSLRVSNDNIFSFKWDGTAPTFTGATLISSESPKTYGNKDSVYFKVNPTIRLSATDNGTLGVGVNAYTIGNTSNKTGEFTLGNGNHLATVSDLLNNTSAANSVVSLLGWNALNNFIIDNTAPSLQITGINPDLRDTDKKEWYAKKPSLQVKVSDANLRDVVTTVTRADGSSTVVIRQSSNGTFDISLDSVGDGKVEIEATATDKAENVTKASYTFYLDRTAPTGLDGTVNQSFMERDTGTFFKKKPTLTLTAKDAGVGVNKFYLDDNSSNTSGSFVLEDGRHTTYVDDRLGNKTNPVVVNKSGLKSVGFSNSRIVTDGVNPVISCKRPEGDVNSWYAKDQTFNATITDNVAIQQATIKINGTKIAEFVSKGTDEKSINLSASTSKTTAKKDGGYDVLIEVEDKAGNTANWTDTIKIDRDAPKITKFVFSNTSINGSQINGGNVYGFFSTGVPTVKIYAEDGDVTSGLSHAVVDVNGSTRQVSFVAGVATLALPSNTKGFISAYAVDRVLNKGNTERPDGYVSESSNTHVNSMEVNISLPVTTYKDTQGLPLYNRDLSLTVTAGCRMSGIASMRWGIGDKTVGRSVVDLNGTISGNVGVKTTDRNLVLTLKDTLPVPNNENNIELWVQITDRLGHVSEDRKRISIDKDIPEVTLTYTDGPTTKSFYSKERKATLAIKERNLNKDDIRITGTFGKMGTWRKSGETWLADVTFGEEKDYNFTINVTDMAGNRSKTITDKFTVDAQAPRITIKFDNNDVKNKKYYKKARKATITVVDANFDPNKVEYQGRERLGKWVNTTGNTWQNTINFIKDGKYSFKLKCTDKAGNVSDEAKVDEFVIDKTLPSITIAGVSDGMSYKQSIPVSVGVSDANLNPKKIKVELKGKKNGVIELESKLDETTGIYTLSGFDEDKKYDDIYALTVEVTDKAGNVSKETIMFSLNRYGSEFSDDGNIFGHYLNKARDIDISEQNLERIDVSKCSITVLKDGKTLDVLEGDYSIKEQEEEFGWKYIYHLDKDIFKEDGTYQIQIYSVLYDGTDYSSASKEYTFMLDTTDPEILITGIESGKTYKDYSRVVTVDIRDLSGVDNLQVFVNGSLMEVDGEDGLYTFEMVEGPQLQNVSVSATDMAGNNSVEGVNAVMITSNTVLYTINQPWFRWLVGSVGALSAGLVGLLLVRRIRTRKKERELAKSQLSEIKKSSSGSGSGSGSGSTEVK